MAIIRKALTLGTKDYYKMHLNIVNPFLSQGLTNTEIEILSSFMGLEDSVTVGDPFNTYARKLVKESLDKMSSGSLSNHLRSMIDKGVLDKNNISERITIKEFLIPEEKMQGYQFKISLDETK